jgi:ABC-2 type transport system ATP-binding protein
MSRSPLIRVRGLEKRYGGTLALAGLDLDVPAGAFYGLLGPNGAGKSTTIGVLTGVLRATAGSVEILGRPYDPDDPWFKARVGVVSEEPPLFERLTGREQLVLVGRLFGLPRAEAGRRAEALLGLLELEADGRARVAELSRGMRKKLAIGCALIHGPELLFLDEPFEGIDATSALTLRRLLAGLTARGATVLLTTHILEVAQKICHRVGILNRGRLVRELDLAELEAQRGDLAEVFRAAVGASSEPPVLPDWLAEREPRDPGAG